MFLWLSPDSRKPGRLHFAGVAGESVSAPFPDVKQWLKLFFGCPALFDSCDGVGGVECQRPLSVVQVLGAPARDSLVRARQGWSVSASRSVLFRGTT